MWVFVFLILGNYGFCDGKLVSSWGKMSSKAMVVSELIENSATFGNLFSRDSRCFKINFN